MTAGLATDPQGGRFHLLTGADDWRACSEVDPDWPERRALDAAPGRPPSDLQWDGASGSLRLAHRDAVLRRPSSVPPRRAEERRGADRDRYGSWYWITDDRRGIVRLRPGATEAEPWWSLADLSDSCASGPSHDGHFGAVVAGVPAEDARLAGLAVTTGHRLAVGLVDDVGGVYLFDLHAVGAPLLLRWPGARAVTPFDLAASADGGILVLDRTRRTWWSLDRTWRLTADVATGAEEAFQPAAGGPRRRADPTVAPLGNRVDVSVVDPIAIVDAAGTTLLLDRAPAGPSAVVVADPSAPSGVAARLPLTVEAMDPTRPDLPAFVLDVVGHDLAFAPEGTALPLPGPVLLVADAARDHTEAFVLALDPPALRHLPDELPLRRWEGKALVASGGDVWYDAVGRWIPLEPVGICTTERTATIRTPTGFGAAVTGQPFDGGQAGCEWHRLFVDASVPDGCGIAVGARASDDPTLLERLPFVRQPTMYLRGAGAELPWHDPWSGVIRPPSPRTGTWELLFQGVSGRYVQLELTLTGTGSTTPSLRALRAWYPRFSYVRAYLPEAYQEEDDADRFLERLLANAEGILTEQELRIEQAWRLVDPRTTTPAALDWLASWMGLHLEPAWTTDRRRFLLRHVDRVYRMRGTARGLRALLRVYLGCRLDEATVFEPCPRPDDPARIVELVGAHRFRVLVPARLDAEQAAMVERIVAAARPSHAAYEIRASTGLLVVGEAQLGLDTVLGDSPAFGPYVLGDVAVGAGVLGAAHPFDVSDRIVTDRDRLGSLPAL